MNLTGTVSGVVLIVLTFQGWAGEGLTPCEIQKLRIPDGAAGDEFGISTALEGGLAVVGARGRDETGAAFVYREDAPGEWIQLQQLTASDGAAEDAFGHMVALDGEIIVIGAHQDDDHGDRSGSVYVFEPDVDGTWSEVAKLTASDGAPGDRFGVRLAICGDTLMVGADGHDDQGEFSGAVYVFHRLGSGNWIEVEKLLASDGTTHDSFGFPVVLKQDLAAIGADNDGGKGSVYIFQRGEGGSWIEHTKVTASDGAFEDHFGTTVSLTQDTLVVGAYGDDDHGLQSGSAYIFKEENGQWVERAKLTADDAGESQYFGIAVAIEGDTVLVGSFRDTAGAAYLFREQDDGSWMQITRFVASDADPFSYFGVALALHRERAVIGSPADEDHGFISGSAYVFDLADCNENGVGDFCDIQAGLSEDCNGNGRPDECDLPGDLNGDGVVGFDDLMILCADWGDCPPADCCVADIDHSGAVGFNDLLTLLAHWG